MQLFGKFGVFTRAELESRSEIMYETYTKVISIEARTMLHMAGKHYIPAVVRNCTRLADSVCKVHTACPAAPTGVQETLLCQTSELLTKAPPPSIISRDWSSSSAAWTMCMIWRCSATI